MLSDAERLFSEARPPDAVSVDKGHGRLERRELRASADLAGYSAFPGLAQVAQVRTRVVRLATGEVTEQERCLLTSLDAARAGPAVLLGLRRGHWGIENKLFHVKDDGFGEDRQVVQAHDRGQVVGLLRSTALTLLRGRCSLWREEAPLTARAEWVNAHPSALLARLDRL